MPVVTVVVDNTLDTWTLGPGEEILRNGVQAAGAYGSQILWSRGNIYVLGDQVQGWYSVDERTPEPHRGEDEHEIGASGVAHELAEAGAAYAGAGDVQKRRRAREHGEEEEGADPADAAQKDGS